MVYRFCTSVTIIHSIKEQSHNQINHLTNVLIYLLYVYISRWKNSGTEKF